MRKHTYQQNQLIIRTNDKKIFLASYPSEWNDGDSIVNIITGKVKWYFREIIEKSKWGFRFWEETGNIWQPQTNYEFDVINFREHHRRYHERS